ncbi:MAG: signal peptidase II [Candidatus Omnitrophica bacterium]|nr:signal peptidase II [Candidatus Omnitrophota bacterium]
MFRVILPLFSGLFILLADQAVKFYLANLLRPGQSIPVLKNIFHITLVLNPGCAFGLLKNVPNIFFLAASLAVVIFLIYLFARPGKKGLLDKFTIALLISGSISNSIDRMRVGYVIDFLDFRVWPVFNLGDSAITIAVTMLVLNLVIKRKT